MASEEIDYYAVLQVSPTATLQEIKTAYRQRSLKVHPDRNPDNPDAAALFHSLRLAADILLDPIQRTTFDTLQAARNAKAERFKGLNNKRKALAEDLQRREMEFKKSRGELDLKSRNDRNYLESLKEEGRKLREGRDKVLADEAGRDEEVERIRVKDRERKKKEEAERGNSGIVELGPMDLMLKLKFTRSLHPTLTSTTSVLTFLDSLLSTSTTSNSTSNSTYSNQNIDTLVLSPKFLSNPTKGKHGTGMISFKTLNATVEVMNKMLKEEGKGDWNGIEFNWASGSAPAILGLKSEETIVEPVVEKASSFPTSMLVDGDEDRILALLRAKERAKIIADLEREDAELDG